MHRKKNKMKYINRSYKWDILWHNICIYNSLAPICSCIYFSKLISIYDLYLMCYNIFLLRLEQDTVPFLFLKESTTNLKYLLQIPNFKGRIHVKTLKRQNGIVYWLATHLQKKDKHSSNHMDIDKHNKKHKPSVYRLGAVCRTSVGRLNRNLIVINTSLTKFLNESKISVALFQSL